MNSLNIRKNIVFPQKLVDLIDSKREVFGLSFADYVRHTLTLDVKEIAEQYPLVNSKTEKSIGRALRDVKNNKVITLEKEEEIDKFLKKI